MGARQWWRLWQDLLYRKHPEAISPSSTPSKPRSSTFALSPTARPSNFKEQTFSNCGILLESQLRFEDESRLEVTWGRQTSHLGKCLWLFRSRILARCQECLRKVSGRSRDTSLRDGRPLSLGHHSENYTKPSFKAPDHPNRRVEQGFGRYWWRKMFKSRGTCATFC